MLIKFVDLKGVRLDEKLSAFVPNAMFRDIARIMIPNNPPLSSGGVL
ncbi:MAG TPA: hypothetical protein VMT95_14865 [Candidatus Binatia bacterium]|nr:hypothetical protein [Candidatus Binatia bacterium]